MANVLTTPSHTAHLSYNGFDMSQYIKFSSTTGELLPVYYDIVYPGDKVRMSSILKTRTMPLNSAAMTQITEHIDWFAVPLDQIYSLFSVGFYNVNDIHSSLFDSAMIDFDGAGFMPYIPVSDFQTFLSNSVSRADAYFTSTDPQTPAGAVYSGTSYRLIELLGIPMFDYSTVAARPTSFNAINPMLACAYQKIYYDYFRLSDREVQQPNAFNVDQYYGTRYITSQSDIRSMYTLRYRPWKKDFFTHLYVSPLFGIQDPVTSLGSSGSSLGDYFNQWLLSSVQYASGSTFPLDNDSLGTNAIVDPVGPTALGGRYVAAERTSPASALASTLARTVSAATSPTSIRTSFAVQKLLEVTRRAGKHVDDQTLAHFGVKTSSRISGECYHIGHSSSNIVIGDVIATAETLPSGNYSGTALGQIGGKGYNNDTSKEFQFENKEACPCIIMAIYSAEPVMDYKPLMMEKFNTYLKRGDFFVPEFDNLGMQPLFQMYARYLESPVGSITNSSILGWQYRWMESKCKYNKIYGSLARSLDYWTTYRIWQDTGLTSFLVSPFSLNSIMVKAYDFDASDGVGVLEPSSTTGKIGAWDNDPLIHECSFNVYKSSKMSSFGLESL